MRHNYEKYISFIVFLIAFVTVIYCDKLKNHNVVFKDKEFNLQAKANTSENGAYGDGSEKRCETSEDCANGTQCVGNTCKCKPKISGEKCQDIDDCKTKLKDCTGHIGDCKYDVANGKAICTCKETGKAFDAETGLCRERCETSDDCANGAQCVSNVCKCQPKTSGEKCQDIDECKTELKDCTGDIGDCKYDVANGKAICTCKETGNAFDEETGLCRERCETSEDCSNGAKCVDNVCKCKPKTSGEKCQDIDDCKTELKDCTGDIGDCKYDVANGKAICTCKETGKAFDAETGLCRDKCMSQQDCKYGSTCDKNFCICKPGLSGDKCDIVDECMSKYKNCKDGNGECSYDETKDEAVCKCSGAKLYDVEAHLCKDPCLTNPCQNGGTCKIKNGKMVCECKSPFSGSLCEIGPCVKYPCKNGGTCQEHEGERMCVCPLLYGGRDCEIEADRCALLLAKGECNKEHEICYKGKCICKKFYVYSKDRKACEADFCGIKSETAVCPENAKCNEIKNGYECVCKEGFYQKGVNCKKINLCSPGMSMCEQFCDPADGKCACGVEFTLNDDNASCRRKKSDECNKDCGKGTCSKVNGEEYCICPNATHVHVDTGCADYCTLKGKSPPGMCPGDKCIPDEKFAFRCDCEDPYEMAKDGIHCKRKAMCSYGGGNAACTKKNAKCEEDITDEKLGYKCMCDIGFVKLDNGTCVNACDLKNCEASRARCELNGTYEAVCKCPLLMSMGIDGMCTIVDNSYIAKLKVLKRKYEIHIERKQSKRSLEDTVDYVKLREDFELSLKNVYSDYRDLKLLNCTDEGKELECNLELQLKKAASKNTINLIFQPSICIPLKDTSYCWIKPNLIVQIGKPEEVFHVANPCTEEIQKLCGPVASCKQLKNTSSFQCLCKDGFKSINTFHLTSLSTIEICEDIDECQEQTSCPSNTECFNIFGSYDCQCKQGYRPTETKSIKESGCIAVCDPNPCKHGECVQFGNHGFLCSCDEEYGGAFCNSTNELVKKVKKSGVTKAAVVGVVLGLILAVVLIGGYMYFRTDRKESHEYAQNANQNVFPYMRGRDSSGRNLGTAAQNSGHMGAESGQRDTMRSKLRRSLDKSKLVPNVRWSRHSDGEYTEIIDGIVEGDIENQNRSFSKSSDHLGK